MDVFDALWSVRSEERFALSSVRCTISPWRFNSLVFSLQSARASVSSFALRYTNDHHHPPIDSTTILSNIPPIEFLGFIHSLLLTDGGERAAEEVEMSRGEEGRDVGALRGEQTVGVCTSVLASKVEDPLW